MLERSFVRAGQLKENSNPVRKLAIAQARRILQEAGVVDPELEGDLPQAVKAETAPKIDLRQQSSEADSEQIGSFTVGIRSPTKNPISFNWLIIN